MTLANFLQIESARIVAGLSRFGGDFESLRKLQLMCFYEAILFKLGTSLMISPPNLTHLIQFPFDKNLSLENEM